MRSNRLSQSPRETAPPSQAAPESRAIIAAGPASEPQSIRPTPVTPISLRRLVAPLTIEWTRAGTPSSSRQEPDQRVRWRRRPPAAPRPGRAARRPDPIDAVETAARRQPNSERARPRRSVAERFQDQRQDERTTIGERSSMPVGGRTRRIGARIGSVAWYRNREAWLRPLASNQLMRTRPRMRSGQRQRRRAR